MIRFTALKFTLSHFVNQVTRPTECFVPNLLLNTAPEALHQNRDDFDETSGE